MMESKYINNRFTLQKGLTLFLLMLASILPTTLLAKVYWVDDIKSSDLGRGFNQYSEKLLDHCVEGTVLPQGNEHSEVRFMGSGDSSRRKNQMYGKVAGEVDFFLFGGGASVEMTSRLSNTSRSFSSVLQLSMEGGGKSLEGRTPLPLDNKNCGDEFIYHIKYGQKLYLSTKLFFSSRESYEKFVTTVKIKVLFFTKKKTFVKEALDIDEQARYVVEVISPNRLPTKLTNILINNRTNCKINNIDDCLVTTEKLFSYLFSPTGYAIDVKQEDYVPIYVETRSYRDSGHWEVSNASTPVDPKLQQWGFDIKRILENSVEERDYLLATCTDTNSAQCDSRIEELKRLISQGNITLEVCRTQSVADCEAQYIAFTSNL